MFPELELFLCKYLVFSPDELKDITNRFRIKKVKKNEYIFRQSEVSKDFIFVRNGCLRLFYFNGDTEISVWFAFADSSAIEIASFISQSPSDYNMQAIEDSEVLYLPAGELNKLCDNIPGMQVMMKKFWEDVVVTLVNRFTALQRYSAEKRYLDLLSTPAYLQKVPQKYLASYIGVTPTSLSRIRRNLR